MNTGSNGPGEVSVAEDEKAADGSTAEEREPGLGSRAPQFVKARRMLHLSWQVAVHVVVSKSC